MNFEMIKVIASLTFLIMLLLVYNSKKQMNNINNKVFKAFIYSSIIFSIIEILCFISNIYIVSLILTCFYYLFGLISFEILFIYLYLKLKNIKDISIKNLFNNLLIKITLVCMILLSIIIIISINDVYNLINNEISNLLMFIFMFALFTIILYLYIKNKNNVSKTLRFVIFISIFNYFIFEIIGFLVLDMILYFEFFVTCSYILYFSFANPDISIIDEINLAQKDIEKINKTKTDFLSNMSYEIKIPIDMINNLCEDILSIEELDQDKIKKDLKDVITSGNNLIEIVNNVLDISKLESGRSVLIEKEYNLKDMVDDLSAAANTKIGNKSIELSLNIDSSLPSILYGDYSKLYRSVLNVVNNAIKFTEVGKVTISLSGEKKDDNIKLLFKISDTGNGIKEEEKELLFSKGVKLNNSASGDEVGSGFGLSISKEYLTALGGKIWFESEYRAGSTFYIEVNQKIKNILPLSEYSKDNKTTNIIDLSNKRVLIVDDNKPNVKVVKRLLEKYNLKVDSVYSGEECVYKIKGEEKYDLIFMDHIMEGMDGIETLHVIKNLEGYVIPPVIALTANALNDTKDLYIKEGFDGYLSKPVTIKELDKIVNKYFKEP